MWDSARKPMKIRTILNPDGTRHFLLNDDISKPSRFNDLKNRKDHQNGCVQNKLIVKVSSCENLSNTLQQDVAKVNCNNLNHWDSSSLLLKEESVPYLTHKVEEFHLQNEKFTDHEKRSFAFQDELGICGSKLYSIKGRRNRLIQKSLIGPFLLDNSSGSFDEECLSTFSDHKIEFLDMIPVRSPVIKSLIQSSTTQKEKFSVGSGSSTSSGCDIGGSGSTSRESSLAPDGLEKGGNNRHTNCSRDILSPENKLCSRIMTWINLEVRKNGSLKSRALAPGVSPADFRMLAGGLMPIPESQNSHCTSFSSCSLSSSTSGSRRSSCTELNLKGNKLSFILKESGESLRNDTGESSESSSNRGSGGMLDKCCPGLSLPKLLVSNLKQSPKTHNMKKTVKISEDLPKWQRNSKSEEPHYMSSKKRKSKNSYRNQENTSIPKITPGSGTAIVKRRQSIGKMVTGLDYSDNEENNNINHIENINNKSKWMNSEQTDELDESGYFGEVRIDDYTVYLMGETKSRPVCKIEVPEKNTVSLSERCPDGNNNTKGNYGKQDSDGGCNGKVQVHIFLPVTE
jgi:hypothetical protein